MSSEKAKYVSGILILLTLEIIFVPVLKIGTWDISLIKILKMLYGNSNSVYISGIKEVLKQYAGSYVCMLLFLIALTLAVGLSVWLLKKPIIYCIELVGQAAMVITAVMIARMIKEKMDLIGSVASYWGLGNAVKFNMLPFVFWGIIQIAAVVVNIYGLMNMNPNPEASEIIIPREIEPVYNRTDYFPEKKEKVFSRISGLNKEREERDFFGAIVGVESPYAGMIFSMDKKKYVYLFRKDGIIFVKKQMAEKQNDCIAKIYFDTNYKEYVVIPEQKCCIHLESGQPLGKDRAYYLPRAMKIVIKNESGQIENIFELA